MEKHILRRIVIYTKDIENITGRKSQMARKLLRQIREGLGKEKHAFITVSEFCKFTGLPEEEVWPFLL